jgi:hypothetical protein
MAISRAVFWLSAARIDERLRLGFDAMLKAYQPPKPKPD